MKKVILCCVLIGCILFRNCEVVYSAQILIEGSSKEPETSDKILSDEELTEYIDIITVMYNESINVLNAEFDRVMDIAMDTSDKLDLAVSEEDKTELSLTLEGLQHRVEFVTDMTLYQSDLYDRIMVELTSGEEMKESVVQGLLQELTISSEEFSSDVEFVQNQSDIEEDEDNEEEASGIDEEENDIEDVVPTTEAEVNDTQDLVPTVDAEKNDIKDVISEIEADVNDITDADSTINTENDDNDQEVSTMDAEKTDKNDNRTVIIVTSCIFGVLLISVITVVALCIRKSRKNAK